MNCDVRQLVIGDAIIDYELRRSDRKTLGISVSPDGSVIVSAPSTAAEARIEERLRKRAPWILDRLDEVALRAPPLGDRRYLPGETHLFLGRQYRLRVDPDRLGTVREEDRIIVGGVRSDEPTRIRNRLNRWYEKEGWKVFSERLTACMSRFGKETRPPRLKVAPMERRWGSYVPETRSLILNRVLVQAPIPLIDYVITHELCHIHHPHHGSGFQQLLARMMPDWAARKHKLEVFFT